MIHRDESTILNIYELVNVDKFQVTFCFFCTRNRAVILSVGVIAMLQHSYCNSELCDAGAQVNYFSKHIASCDLCTIIKFVYICCSGKYTLNIITIS